MDVTDAANTILVAHPALPLTDTGLVQRAPEWVRRWFHANYNLNPLWSVLAPRRLTAEVKLLPQVRPQDGYQHLIPDEDLLPLTSSAVVQQGTCPECDADIPRGRGLVSPLRAGRLRRLCGSARS